MEYIEDLSFSNITNIIQGEEIKGSDLLNCIALEMEENKKKIEQLEYDLACAKGREGTLIEGSKRVLKHLGKHYPLAVKRKEYIVVVTENYISIERNVL
jgi:hypothetical protein